MNKMKLGSNYYVVTDKLNFILLEQYDSKDKDGNTVSIKGRRKYFPKIELLIDYLLSNEIKKSLGKGEIKQLEDIQSFLEVCLTDLAGQIKFTNPIAKKNFFDSDK